MPMRTVVLITAAIVLLSGAARAQDRWRIDVENGAAISGYNDLRIPGDSGTTFSLTDDLSSDPTYYWRLRAAFLSRH